MRQFNNVSIKYKYSKPIFIQVNLTYNVSDRVCFLGKLIAHFITTSRIIHRKVLGLQT